MQSFLLCGSPLDATLLGAVERIKPTLISSTGHHLASTQPERTTHPPATRLNYQDD